MMKATCCKAHAAEEISLFMSDATGLEVVAHVQLGGGRGAFARNSPPNHSLHHQAQDPTKIELIPRG